MKVNTVSITWAPGGGRILGPGEVEILWADVILLKNGVEESSSRINFTLNPAIPDEHVILREYAPPIEADTLQFVVEGNYGGGPHAVFVNGKQVGQTENVGGMTWTTFYFPLQVDAGGFSAVPVLLGSLGLLGIILMARKAKKR